MKLLFVVEADEAAVVADENYEGELFSVAVFRMRYGEKKSTIIRWILPLRLAALRALGLCPLQVFQASSDFVPVQRGSSASWPVTDHARVKRA